MFSLERFIFSNKLSIELDKKKKNSSWKENYWGVLLNNIIHIIYFQDHLARHSKNVIFYGIIINNSLDLETLALLNLIKRQYCFIYLKKLEKTIVNNNDLEHSFMVNSTKQNFLNKFLNADCCLLIGSNPRFEGYSFNLKLRQAILKNNLSVNVISAYSNLTYPTKNIGSNIKVVSKIAAGNHIFCQQLKTANRVIVVTNSEVLKRTDSPYKGFQLIKRYLPNAYNKSWNGLNLINTTLSETGFQSFESMKFLSLNDFKLFNTLHFININLNSLNLNLKKFFEYKLLNIINSNLLSTLEQNYITSKHKTTHIQNLNLRNRTFFETIGTYISTEGLFIRLTNIIKSNKNNSKSDYNIIKNLFFYFRKINYICNLSYNRKLNYLTISHIMDFLYLPSNYIILKLTSYYKLTLCCWVLKNRTKYKERSRKLFGTTLYLWLEDFYVNGKDLYSFFSLKMIKTSTTMRKLTKTNNFLY
jgi:NADH dehydrogenase/NADH:ubiquinone oxidoreductase subunit G